MQGRNYTISFNPIGFIIIIIINFQFDRNNNTKGLSEFKMIITL